MTRYHNTGGGVWKRCVAREKCPKFETTEHTGSRLAIAMAGGGFLQRDGRQVEIRPYGDGYMTISDNGQVAVYDANEKPIPLAKRLKSGWKKDEELAASENGDRLRELYESMREQELREAAKHAISASRKTQQWRRLQETILLKNQELIDAHGGETPRYGDDPELDAAIDQQLALAYDHLHDYEAFEQLTEMLEASRSEWTVATDSKSLTSHQRRKRGYIDTKGASVMEPVRRSQEKVAASFENDGKMILDFEDDDYDEDEELLW